MSLRSEATKGVAWVAFEKFGAQGVQFAVFVVLARLLTPADFGLIAMVTVFFAISETFIDGGMAQALIREKEISDNDRSTVFWLNMAVAVSFFAILYFAAPYIATFYNEPRLVDLVRIMAFTVIIQGLASVQYAELNQRMEFKNTTMAKLPSVVVSGSVGIILALQGFGVWALATKFVLSSFLSTLSLWIIYPRGIKFIFNSDSFNRLFGFGYKLLLSSLINTIYQNIYKIVIGKFFSAATLGFFAQARKLQDLVTKDLVSIIQRVTYPLLSKVNDDLDRLINGYRSVIMLSSFVIFPATILLFIYAEPLVINLFGPQWQPSAPMLRIIGFSGLLYHLHAINLNVLKVMGRSDLFLKLEIIKKVNITLFIIIGLQFGIYGLLVCQVISSYIALYVNSYYTKRLLEYSFSRQIMDVLKVLVLSVPMMLFSFLVISFFNIDNFGLLIGALTSSGIIYILSFMLFRNEVSKLVLSFISPHLSPKIKGLLHV